MRTDENLTLICDGLRKYCGDLYEACKQAGISVDFLTRWLKDDTVAAEQVEEAQRVGWMGLESEVIRRAVRGVEEAVYYKGEIVGHKTVYSDGLLVKAVEARVPAYSKKEAGGGGINATNVQINFMPRASSYDEWLAMKDTTLARRQDQMKMIGGGSIPELLQGEYVATDPRGDMSVLEGLL